jgi:hypothetical protein
MKSAEIKTEIIFKATGKLQAEVEKELLEETPDLEKAEAIINENSIRNDRRDSSSGNTEN